MQVWPQVWMPGHWVGPAEGGNAGWAGGGDAGTLGGPATGGHASLATGVDAGTVGRTAASDDLNTSVATTQADGRDGDRRLRHRLRPGASALRPGRRPAATLTEVLSQRPFNEPRER